MNALCAQLKQMVTLESQTDHLSRVSNLPTPKLQQNDCDTQQQKGIYDIDAPIFLHEETST